MTDEQAADRRRWYPTWLVMQREYVALSTRSRHVIADLPVTTCNSMTPTFVVREFCAFLDL